MLASSPNTIAETELALEHPEPSDPGRRFRRPRSQRLSFSAWAAIGWLLIVLFGATLIPMFLHSDPLANATKGWSSQGMFKVAGHPLGFDRNGNDMLLLLAKGARSSMLVSIGAVTFGLLVGGSLGLA